MLVRKHIKHKRQTPRHLKMPMNTKYKLPSDHDKLREEIQPIADAFKRYSLAREAAGLSIEPKLMEVLKDSTDKIGAAFKSGDQQTYQNARKAIDDAFVKFGVEAPSNVKDRNGTMKTIEKYIWTFAALACFFAICFPPWLYVYDGPAPSDPNASRFGRRSGSSQSGLKLTRSAGYALLVAPESLLDEQSAGGKLGFPYGWDGVQSVPPIADLRYITLRLDKERLALQIAGLLFLAWAFAAHRSKSQ